MISILAPSRGRPDKSKQTIHKWINSASDVHQIELIVSCDLDDPELSKYENIYSQTIFKTNPVIANKNRSAVDAINHAASVSKGNILIVVSDDTDCFPGWDKEILKEVGDTKDWILKTQDGIQPWIITMPIMDRAYYNRFGYIYHPDYSHQFCDTYATCVADITGRKITSNLLFPHLNDSIKDDLRKKTDGTWKQGQDTFIRLMKQFSPADRAKITDPTMKNWLRNHGVR